MTLDAMDWVWQHSRTRGNPRMVMLAVADAITGPEATARIGTATLVRRLNATKGTTLAAVASAIESGELAIEQPAAGSRAALYRIPDAVNYSRRTGRESGPQPQRSETPTTTRLRSETRTATAPDSGPESGPQGEAAPDGFWSEFQTGSGPESVPHHSPIEGVSEGGRERGRVSVAGIPAFARPLVDAITAAGVIVRWDLNPTEWFTVDARLKQSGADMLAAVAVRAAGRKDVSHARYFLRAWTGLPPAPAAGTTPAAAPAAGPGADVIPLNRPRTAGTGRAAQAADWYADLLAEEN
ncbi:hypothetical protein [Streptomyces sp. NBC_00343]|uniref:hypothetical protein n=1 Tax=Streptomyces sp. NBC_00343 TaxID=2975719 RepID=UPI002E29F33F|nr:hypothetical protein [Streptomyces sp. NBC_00343]